MESFGTLLTQLLKDRDLSQRQFAETVGVSQSYVAQMARGEGPLAREHIDPWAEKLSLKGRDLERFRLLALLTRCPPEVREYVRELERQVQQQH